MNEAIGWEPSSNDERRLEHGGAVNQIAWLMTTASASFPSGK